LADIAVYARSMTKYKLLKDFLLSCLIYSLIINRSGQLINVYTILILFQKPANSLTILNVVLLSVAV